MSSTNVCVELITVNGNKSGIVVYFQAKEVDSLTLSLLMSYTVYIYMQLLVKPEILMSCIYMDLRLAMLKAICFYLLHNVLMLNQCRKLFCGTVVCKHFTSYQGYPNYRRDVIW
jgi:hypothetical protein